MRATNKVNDKTVKFKAKGKRKAKKAKPSRTTVPACRQLRDAPQRPDDERVRVGSDFSGAGPEAFALENLGIKHDLAFCSEVKPSCRKFIEAKLPPEVLVRQRAGA